MKLFRLFLPAALFAVSLAAWPHGGEDHSADAHAVPAAAPATAAPRAVAASEDFELVAALEDGRLILYLDRYATGEPLAGARVEVESGDFKASAGAVSPGVYVLSGERFAAPGRYPLTITVEAGDTVDLLSATLERRPPVSAAASASLPWPTRTAWGVAAGLLAAALGLLMRRWRKQRRH